MSVNQRVGKVFELPTKEQQSKSIYKIEDSSEGKRVRNITQTPLDLYLNRSWIDIKQYEAGNRYFTLWFYGAEKNGYKGITYSTEPRSTLKNFDKPYMMEEAYKKAFLSIKGLPQRKVCFDVCCIGEFASKVNISQGKNARMNLLKSALDDLVKHFNIK